MPICPVQHWCDGYFRKGFGVLCAFFHGERGTETRRLCQYLCRFAGRGAGLRERGLLCIAVCVFSLSMMNICGRIFVLVLGFAVLVGAALPSFARNVEPRFNSSGLPLPRFVSVSADEAHVRAGPATRYPIKWVYKKRGLPVEIVQEFDVWRKVRDRDGDEGWLHQSLLSGRRSVIVVGEEPVSIRSQDSENSRSIARLQPGVIATVSACKKAWCKVSSSGYEGWAERNSLWGIYATEEFD